MQNVYFVQMMKHLTMRKLLFLLVLFFNLNAFAQEAYKVTTISDSLKYGVLCPCYVIDVNDISVDDMSKIGNDWVEDFSKMKEETSEDGVNELKGIVFETLENDSLTASWKTIPSTTGATFVIGFFDLKGNAIVNEHLKNVALRKELDKLGYTFYHEVLEQKLDKEEDKLKDLEKELSKAQKDEESILKDISSEKVDIQNHNESIHVLESEVSAISGRIGNQKNVVATSSEKDVKKEAEKVLKEMEKSRDDLFDEKEKLHKKIVEAESEIREMEFELTTKKTEVENFQKKVASQRIVVDELEDELKMNKKRLK